MTDTLPTSTSPAPAAQQPLADCPPPSPRPAVEPADPRTRLFQLAEQFRQTCDPRLMKAYLELRRSLK